MISAAINAAIKGRSHLFIPSQTSVLTVSMISSTRMIGLTLAAAAAAASAFPAADPGPVPVPNPARPKPYFKWVEKRMTTLPTFTRHPHLTLEQ